MKLMLEEVKQLANGVWLSFAPPHQLTKFGNPQSALGLRSVILAASPEHDEQSDRLILDADNLTILNVGTTPSVVVVDTVHTADVIVQQRAAQLSEQFGQGDREFLDLVDRSLRGDAKDASRALLRAIRAKSPGDLKRGERLNFSNQPDNFWYVIIQPRVQALSITVRGLPERFAPSSLELKVDRPGYTRFSVHGTGDIAEALRIIGLSKRKGER